MRRLPRMMIVLAALFIEILLAGLPFAGPPAAGEVTARIEIAQGEFTVGDTIELKLIVTHPPGAVFDYPDVAGPFGRPAVASATTPALGGATGAASATAAGEVASLMVEEVKPFEGGGPVDGRTVWSIRMRVFAPGPRVLPAVTLGYRLTGASQRAEVSTEPVTITVASVLTDKQEDAADIKGQWLLPRHWGPWLMGGALVLAALALATYLWRRFGRKRQSMPAPAKTPVVATEPAYDRALRELASLLASTLLPQGRVKEFHVALSEIVKRLIGSLHGFDALDRTTEELLADLRGQDLPPGLREETGLFLRAADLVKFAKHHPASAEIDHTVDAARRIIETGRPAPVAAGQGVAA